jgi:hypothetical protein
VSPPGELAMFFAIGAAAVGLFFGPIGSAIAQRVFGRQGAIDARAEIEDMGGRFSAEMDELRHRLAEVEERLDFAERLLAQEVSVNQLPRGAQQ